MGRVTAVFVLAALAAAGPAVGRSPRAGFDTGLVELDVVVADSNGQSIAGLTRADFVVKEDGHPVEVKTFEETSASAESDGRSVALLLDDSGIRLGGGSVVQHLARMVLGPMRAADEITVVRLSNASDEAYGDIQTALQRILDYRAGAVPYSTPSTEQRALRVIASMSRQLAAVDHRRKALVCIGVPSVCNMREPSPRGYYDLWDPWVEALAAASDANVAVYGVMPVRPGDLDGVGGGLVEFTGGTSFANSSRLDRFIDSLWRDVSHYYFVGYWSAGAVRELHDVEVKVTRKGAKVRARRARGEMRVR